MKTLVEKLEFYRAGRPDEWSMDEFIRDAKMMQKENAELKAHCEFLRECCHRLGNGLKVEKDEVDSVPQQSLSEIKAQGIEEMFYEFENEYTYHSVLPHEVLEYANKLRSEK